MSTSQPESSRRMSRRELLKNAGLGGAALWLAPHLAGRALAVPPLDRPPGLPLQKLLNPRTLKAWKDPLPVPPELSASTLNGGTLTMAAGAHVFHSDLTQTPTPTWGYGGAAYLGPTIRATTGQPTSFTAQNNLGPHPLSVDTALHGALPADANQPRASLHKHGGYTEPGSDGHPEDTFLPGATHAYNYSNDQQAGPIWYHDHALGITRLNVYAGLAGFYYIDGPSSPQGVPSAYGVDDFPVVLQDKAFDRTTMQLYYPAAWVPEFFGNVPVVNGAILPRLDVRSGVYRLRLVNGSSSRFYTVRFTGGVQMWQIATDSGYLPASVPLTRLILAPGERAEVVVDFTTATDTTAFLFDERLPAPAVSPSPGQMGQMVRFDILPGAAPTPGPFNPTAYVGPSFTPLPPSPSKKRYVTLVEIMDPATGAPVLSLLNNRLFATDDVEKPTVDTLEEWEIINLTADTHPIHLHLVQFQVKERQPIDDLAYITRVYGTGMLTVGQENTGPAQPPAPLPAEYLGAAVPPSPYESGWKDTVQAHPGMVTRILVPFGPKATAGLPFGQDHRSAPYTGRYVWHCHILDHEDNEMMLPYEVVTTGGN